MGALLNRFFGGEPENQIKEDGLNNRREELFFYIQDNDHFIESHWKELSSFLGLEKGMKYDSNNSSGGVVLYFLFTSTRFQANFEESSFASIAQSTSSKIAFVVVTPGLANIHKMKCPKEITVGGKLYPAFQVFVENKNLNQGENEDQRKRFQTFLKNA